MNELWQSVKGWEMYEVSSKGRIRRGGSLRTISTNRDGYQYLSLYDKDRHKYFQVHRLVALNFLPTDAGRSYVNHKDGNKKNNFLDNLEWCTHKENEDHALAHGLKSKIKGEARFWNAKITEENARFILNNKDILPADYLANKFGVSTSHVKNIWYGHKWSHL